MYFLALSECQMALWPVMGMLDRISEHAVTICMLGSYRWRNNASKSCSHMQTLVHTDQADLWLGQLILRKDRTLAAAVGACSRAQQIAGTLTSWGVELLPGPDMVLALATTSPYRAR